MMHNSEIMLMVMGKWEIAIPYISFKFGFHSNSAIYSPNLWENAAMSGILTDRIH